MFIEKVQGNLKGGVDLKLGRCTAVIGPNRSRKTAVLDTIRLALTGVHPAGPHGSDLMELAPTDAQFLRAHVEGDLDLAKGTTFSATLTVDQQRGKAKRPVHELVGIKAPPILPVDVAQSIAGLGTAKAREEIFRRFGGDQEMPDPKNLDSEEKALWVSALNSQLAADAASKLAGIGTYMRSRKLGLGKEIGVLEEQIAARAQDTAKSGTVTPDVIAAASARYDAAVGWERSRDARERREQLVAAIRVVEVQLAAARDTKAHLPPPPPPVSGDLKAERDRLTSKRDYAIGLLDAIKQSESKDTCPTCRQKANLVARTQEIEGKVKIIEERLGLAESRIKTASAERADYDLTLMKLTDNIRDLEGKLKRGSDKLAEIDRSIGSATTDPGITSAEAGAKRDELVAAKREAEILSDERSKRDSKVREQDRVKRLEERAAAMLQELLIIVRVSAESTVNSYMPEGLVAKLSLEDGDCRWAVIGTDDRPHGRHVMSGAERGALLIALGLAWTENTSPSPRILLIDDVDLAGFDPSNVSSMLKTIARHVENSRLDQAIICWSRDEVPKGFEVVRIGDAPL